MVLATRSPCLAWRSSPRSPSEDESGSTEHYRGLDLRSADRLRRCRVWAARGDDRCRRSFIGDFPFGVLHSSEARSPSREPLLKWGVYTCIRAIYGAAAGFAALATAAVSSRMATTRLVVATVDSRARRRAARSASSWRSPRRLRGGPALQFLRMCGPMYARLDLPLHADRRGTRGRLYATYRRGLSRCSSSRARGTAPVRPVPGAAATRRSTR